MKILSASLLFYVDSEYLSARVYSYKFCGEINFDDSPDPWEEVSSDEG